MLTPLAAVAALKASCSPASTLMFMRFSFSCFISSHLLSEARIYVYEYRRPAFIRPPRLTVLVRAADQRVPVEDDAVHIEDIRDRLRIGIVVIRDPGSKFKTDPVERLKAGQLGGLAYG